MTHPLPDKAVEAGARAMIAKAYGDHAEQNFGEHFGDLLDAVMADFRSASIGISAALAAEGLVVVPREPTQAMLDAVVTYPAGLVAERNDPEYTAQMQAATATERALAAQRYRAMIEAAREGKS